MINGIISALIGQAKSNPAIAGNPMAKGLIEVLESGDSARGEQIANNLLESYGVTRDEALSQAKGFFNLR